MLLGKKFSMNIRALRIVSLDILKGLHRNSILMKVLFAFLNELSSRSRWAKPWIKKLINPSIAYDVVYSC